MICSNCFEAEYQITHINEEVIIENDKHILPDIECYQCPSCGETIFTHEQSLELDRKRILLEFGTKELLTPEKLKLIRIILGLTLGEMSDLLQIGQNTYGRWERGETAITHSMNLLVHNLIDKYPVARNNLSATIREKLILECIDTFEAGKTSLGQYIQNVMSRIQLHIETIALETGSDKETIEHILFIDKDPESINARVIAKINHFLHITTDNLKKMLDISSYVYSLSSDLTYVHVRKPAHSKKAAERERQNIAEVIEKAFYDSSETDDIAEISQEYMNQVIRHLDQIESGIE